jgi:hypothetical protein
MLSHGYIKHDFDVPKWAAPEFLEQAGCRKQPISHVIRGN